MKAVAGVAGLAAALGGTVYLSTSGNGGETARTTNTAAIAPLAQATSPSAAASTTQARKPAAGTTSSLPPDVAKKIKEAREAGAKYGVKVQHPIIPKAVKPVADVQRSTAAGTDGSVRVIWARGDLTGQQELAYVAGGVTAYQGAECSQTFKFATNPAPAKKDNLVMCWKTSPTKSVAAMVVDFKGHPSRTKAIEAINAKWQNMD
ncbi:hypothetical protein ACQPZX_37765 [Actinoplanes sp. CA-142083]|uniref:hypothetical protein n=1 Tax=Actinoplanes sp. CA-142083 TaxID=3239903 RepID=UPI003D9373A2